MKKETLKSTHFIFKGWLVIKVGDQNMIPVCRISCIGDLQISDIPDNVPNREELIHAICTDLGSLVHYGGYSYLKYEVLRPDGTLKSRKLIHGRYYNRNKGV